MDKSKYDIATTDTETIMYQACEEIVMKKMMDREGFQAFSNTFQDLLLNTL
ncbi:MAG: hypothetical protein WCR02_05855 [Sphaerochaetaceae bacterium]